MEAEEAFQKTFTIYPKHLNFLKNINDDNVSLALRTVLNSIINGKEQTERKQILDRNLNYIWMGVILLILSYLVPLTLKTFIILTGACIVAYGIYGGVRYTLQRTNHH